MKPTPTELALISSELAKIDGSTPEANFAAANALFTKAADYLTDSAEKTGRARFKGAIKLSPMTLKDFLTVKMPKIKTPSLRQTRFYQFLVADYIQKKPNCNLVEGSAERFATSFIEDAKKNGIAVNAYPEFESWYKAKVSAGRTVGAKSMHAKKTQREIVEQRAKAANSNASGRKSRIVYHDHEVLARISDEQMINGKKKATIFLHG